MVNGHPVSTSLQRQQGVEEVMIWAEILVSEMVGPFMVPASYVKLLNNHFLPWHKKKSQAFPSKIIFMQDRVPCHAAKIDSFATMGIKGGKRSGHHHPLTSVLFRTCGASLRGRSERVDSNSGRQYWHLQMKL